MVRQRNSQGMQIHDCRWAWRILGGFDEPVRKTGETRWWHPQLPYKIVTGRGKDGPRRLVRAIIELIDLLDVRSLLM